jgi:glycosyltransferase involved in cell wall biosynthesis
MTGVTMRIMMLSNFYPPFLGGEEHNTRKLSIALAARGHEVSVATIQAKGLPRFEVEAGVRIHRFPASVQRLRALLIDKDRPHLPPAPDPEAIGALRRILTEEQPEVVHAHNWIVHSFLPLKKWSGAKLVMGLHDYSLSCANTLLMQDGSPCAGPGLVKCLACAAHYYGPVKGLPIALANWSTSGWERQMVDAWVTISQAVAVGNGLVARGIPYRTIPNFASDDVPEPTGEIDDHVAALPSTPFLLYVGSFAPQKGVDVLLRAYAGLQDAPPLVLIGYASNGAPRDLPAGVQAFSNWPHAAVMEAWQRSLIGIAPSTWAEPFGTVVLEAIAAGRPVVASRVGGIPDMVVDGENGYLVPPGDADALRGALARLLADPALRARMASMSLQHAQQFRKEVVVQAFEDVYEGVLCPASIASAGGVTRDLAWQPRVEARRV